MDNRSVRITAVTVAVAAVVAVVALLVTTYRDAAGSQTSATEETPPPAGGTPAPAGPVSPDPTTSRGTGHDDDRAYVPDAKTKAALADVTERFLAEWKRPGTPAERTKRIRPYATEWLTSRLADVDPAELPTSRIDGRPRVVAATPYSAGTTTTFSDGLEVRCNLVLDTTGWRVAEVLPDTDTPQPTPPEGRAAAASPSRTPDPSDSTDTSDSTDDLKDADRSKRRASTSKPDTGAA